jgi:hypothetical protein
MSSDGPAQSSSSNNFRASARHSRHAQSCGRGVANCGGRKEPMFLGSKITVGAFVPDDYVAMYCWANEVVAARLDVAFRPANFKDVVSLTKSPLFQAGP